MRLRTLTLALITAVTFTACQSSGPVADQSSAIESFEQFNSYLAEKNWDMFAGMFPDVMIEAYGGKEGLITQMRNAFENPEMMVNVVSTTVLGVNDSLRTDSTQIYVIGFNQVMSMQLSKKDTMMVGMLRTMMTNQYGSENVTFDESDPSYVNIEISADDNSFAISPLEQVDWRFTTVDPSQAELMKQIIPADFFNKTLER